VLASGKLYTLPDESGKHLINMAFNIVTKTRFETA